MKRNLEIMPKKDNITVFFIKYVEGTADLKEVLDACRPLFNKFAYQTHNPQDANSRMSVNLCKLLKKFDSKKGTPLQLIYRMCKNISIDMHKESERRSFITYVDDSRGLFENQEIEFIGYDIDRLENAQDIKDRLCKIINESNLRKSQKDRYDRGGYRPICHNDVIEELRESILADDVLREYVIKKFKLKEVL